MLPTYDELLKQNQEMAALIRTLQQQLDQLQMKLRIMELSRLKGRPVAVDDRQIALGIVPSEPLALVPDPVDPSQSDPKLPSSTTKRGSKPRIRGTDKFAHIEVTRQTVIIPDEVNANPELYEEIGEEEVFELEVTEARITRHRIVRKKFRPIIERTSPPVIAKAPVRFSQDYVSISLAVYIAIGKYLEHGALSRLEKQFARHHVDIPRQTQSDCIERIAKWVDPLYQLLFDQTRCRPYLQIDDGARQRVDGFSPAGVRNAGALRAA